MIRTVLFFFSLMFLGGISAQELNQKDANGKAQGTWKKYFESKPSQPFYEGQFKDDVRVGTWTYYHKSGPKKAEMVMSEKGQVAHTTLFSMRGHALAKGKYVNEKKDSTWLYLYEDGEIRIIENWNNGVKHGPEKSFLRNGGVGEELHYKDGKRDGPFVEYHDKDVKSREGMYLEDEYEGKMTFYYSNGKKEIEGKYLNGKREGTWIYFNDNGSINYQVLYRQGKESKKKIENGLFTDYSPSGTLISEINYKNGLKEGPYTLYHEVGEKVIEKTRDEITGEIINREVIVGNEPKEKGTYKNDLKHGAVQYYNEIGKLIRTEQYVNGQLQ